MMIFVLILKMYSVLPTPRMSWIMFWVCCVEAQFFVGFYQSSCPRAENVVRDVLRFAMQTDPTIAGALLRLHFHDCFVLGCDASILLDDAPGYASVEKTASPNLTLRGYQVIDAMKFLLEAICPQVVSCADILALAARDAVFLSGGPTWDVPTGRRDGRISSARLALLNLPRPSFNAAQLTHNFLAHGLDLEEMVALAGAHTIGMAHCVSVVDRLYRFNATFETDPDMDPVYAGILKQVCPPNSSGQDVKIPMDSASPLMFDNRYYWNLSRRRGLLMSDQQLHVNESTRAIIASHMNSTLLWQMKFVQAMIHMSSLHIQTGDIGEVRRNCRFRNP